MWMGHQIFEIGKHFPAFLLCAESELIPSPTLLRGQESWEGKANTWQNSWQHFELLGLHPRYVESVMSPIRKQLSAMTWRTHAVKFQTSKTLKSLNYHIKVSRSHQGNSYAGFKNLNHYSKSLNHSYGSSPIRHWENIIHSIVDNTISEAAAITVTGYSNNTEKQQIHTKKIKQATTVYKMCYLACYQT